MQNEYRPYFEIEFDFTTSLSKEDAVLAMLGWRMKKPFREVTESECDYQFRLALGDSTTEEESMMYSNHGLSLFEILYEVKESADSKYGCAKDEAPLDENLIAEKIANIKNSHLLIETAYKFYCHIDDELAKGEKSGLRIDQQATPNPENPYITVMSLAQWASKEYKIDLFPSANQITFKELSLSQQEMEESIGDGLGSEGTTNLQITFALLVEAYASTGNTFRHEKHPNVRAITKEICSQIGNTEVIIGMSQRNVTGYISSGLKVKAACETKSHGIKTKTLQICLGLLVEAFAKRSTDFQNAMGDPNVEKIAEHLAQLANELHEQDQKHIETRLLQALEVRKNPDRQQKS
jgi:hypothetical protein